MKRALKFLNGSRGFVIGVAQTMLGAVPRDRLRELQRDLDTETARGQQLRAKTEELRREVDVIQARVEQTRLQAEQDLRRQYDESQQVLQRELAGRDKLIESLQKDKTARHATFMARSERLTELCNSAERLIKAVESPWHQPGAGVSEAVTTTREEIDRARRS